VADYLNDYAAEFNLPVRLNTQVTTLITDVPGLYFIGLPWQHSRGSALLGFVHEDAAYLADRIASCASGRQSPPPGPHQNARPQGGAGGARTHSARPADYEKYGPALRVRYLHGYHRAAPLMALIAPFARAARSANRSTPYHGDHRMPATERYRRPVGARRARRRKASRGEPLLTAEPPDLDYKYEIIRRIHQERDPRPGKCRREPGTPAALGDHARRPPRTTSA
jgi:hypothetical protein